jgi:hypothetical protein
MPFEVLLAQLHLQLSCERLRHLTLQHDVSPIADDLLVQLGNGQLQRVG